MASTFGRNLPHSCIHDGKSARRCGRHRTDFVDQGHEFNRTIWKAFYDLHIEDMWLPFFCNTTNIITSRMQVHETGYAWRYIRESRSGL